MKNRTSLIYKKAAFKIVLTTIYKNLAAEGFSLSN